MIDYFKDYKISKVLNNNLNLKVHLKGKYINLLVEKKIEDICIRNVNFLKAN